MEEGTSVKMSVQSIMILVEGYLWNSAGMFFWISCFDGNGNKSGNSRKRKLIHVVKIFEPCPTEIQNRSARSLRNKPTLRRIKTKKNSSRCDSFRFGPDLEVDVWRVCCPDASEDFDPRQ